MANLTSAQQVLAADMSEARLQGLIAEDRDSLVASLGGMYYHPYRSDRSVEGWPDVALWLPSRADTLVLAELKSMAGVWTPAQRRWRDVLQGVRFLLYQSWQPVDWYSGRIEEVLIHGR